LLYWLALAVTRGVDDIDDQLITSPWAVGMPRPLRVRETSLEGHTKSLAEAKNIGSWLRLRQCFGEYDLSQIRHRIIPPLFFPPPSHSILSSATLSRILCF